MSAHDPGSPPNGTLRVFSIPGRRQTNPYFDLLFDALERLGVDVLPMTAKGLLSYRFDVLHLHFPTHFVTANPPLRAAASALFLSSAFTLARILRKPIVLTVHDVVPLVDRHPWLLWPFYAYVRACVDGYVFLSESSRESFVSRFPRESKKPWRFARHGPYVVERTDAAERAERHDAIAGADAFVVGFLGRVTPHKNVAAIARIPERLADGRRVHLLVAGPADEAQERTLRAILDARSPSSYTRLDARLSDAELDRSIQAVDVVALPYARGSNSGAALLVLSNHGRLVGSTLPMFAELVREPGAPWAAVCDDTAAGWSAALGDMAARPPDAADRERLRDYLASNDYDATAPAIVSLYRVLRAEGRAAR